MREILFRGKRVDNSKWVYGIPVDTEDVIKTFIITHAKWESDDNSIDFLETDVYEIASETVGAYTGLTDKNKTKIFEGDIVEAYKFGEEKHINIITFKNGCFWFGNWTFTEFLDKFRMYKVIGNIHDNPELLEVNNE